MSKYETNCNLAVMIIISIVMVLLAIGVLRIIYKLFKIEKKKNINIEQSSKKSWKTICEDINIVFKIVAEDLEAFFEPIAQLIGVLIAIVLSIGIIILIIWAIKWLWFKLPIS